MTVGVGADLRPGAAAPARQATAYSTNEAQEASPEAWITAQLAPTSQLPMAVTSVGGHNLRKRPLSEGPP